MLTIIVFLIGGVGAILVGIAVWDRYFQRHNLVISNFPLIGRFRYIAQGLRPYFRQYFGDDNAFMPRLIIDWITDVAAGKTGYLSYDKFDTTGNLHDGLHQMIHSSTPLNADEMAPEYPVVGGKRRHPMRFHSFFYRSAMSLGALGFEATVAMAAACADLKTPFNTGEGGFSVHHIPRVKFSFERKFFKYRKAWPAGKIFYALAPGPRLKNYVIDWMGNRTCGKDMRDLYLFDEKYWVFYTIDWAAPLDVFPKPSELTDEFGQIIFQVGSGLYTLRKPMADGTLALDWDRFRKVASFARAIEIKLAQGAKQSGGILKAKKNTPVVAEIRGVRPGTELVSPNRFQFYEAGGEEKFFQFLEEVSRAAGGKPVGIKLVISDASNIEPLARALAQTPKNQGPDFITIDGGDGGSGAAPIATSILFGKLIQEALPIAVAVLERYGVRDRIKLFASSKLYAPHASARVLALGADAIGLARSLMIAGGCIRAGVCSGEKGDCPVGLATMVKSKRRAYAQALPAKILSIRNYLTAHNAGLLQVAAIIGVKSPSLLRPEHISFSQPKQDEAKAIEGRPLREDAERVLL